jgi:hypothetical protein
LFNCTWGTFPAAVSWQATGDQIREDVNTGSSDVVSNVAVNYKAQLLGAH